MAPPVRALIGDAQPMLADGLVRVLGTYPELQVVNLTPSTGPEAVHAIEEHCPQVAVLDYWMEGLDMGQVMATIGHHAPDCKLMVTSWSYSSEQIDDVLKSGAVGFLPKSLTVEEVKEAVLRAAAGENPVYADRLAGLVRSLDERWEQTGEVSRRLSALTPKELEVLTLLSLGHPPEEVAKQMSISRGTVKVHIHSILKKTGARSHTEAVAMARYSGLLLP